MLALPSSHKLDPPVMACSVIPLRPIQVPECVTPFMANSCQYFGLPTRAVSAVLPRSTEASILYFTSEVAQLRRKGILAVRGWGILSVTVRVEEYSDQGIAEATVSVAVYNPALGKVSPK